MDLHRTRPLKNASRYSGIQVQASGPWGLRPGGAGENFKHPSTICRTYGAGRNTLSILRIALKLHFVQNVELDTEIGQKGAFCKGLIDKQAIKKVLYHENMKIQRYKNYIFSHFQSFPCPVGRNYRNGVFS